MEHSAPAKIRERTTLTPIDMRIYRNILFLANIYICVLVAEAHSEW